MTDHMRTPDQCQVCEGFILPDGTGWRHALGPTDHEAAPGPTPDRTPTGDLPDECTGCGRDDGPMYLDPRPRRPSDPQPQYCRGCAADLFDIGDEETDDG